MGKVSPSSCCAIFSVMEWKHNGNFRVRCLISHWFLYPQSVDFTNNTVISEVHTDKSVTPFRNSAYLDTCATSFHITVLNIYIKRGNSTCMLKTIYSQNVVWPFPLGIHLWQCVFAICHLPFFCLLLTTSFGCSHWTVFSPFQFSVSWLL